MAKALPRGESEGRAEGDVAVSPEAQRVAIALAIGWTKLSVEDVWRSPNNTHHDRLPDFPHDLNAMHTAESLLFGKGGLECAEYMSVLSRICFNGTNHATWFLAHATAAQKAKAFLKSIGKWVDEK